MDDAYLFYVPDSGKSFFINFHPIPFDANAKGDYAHRPGNFVNHALVGDFSQGYPYKMFQDDAIWNAKTKGEAYYYENPPTELPERGDIVNPPGRYKFDEIGAFIADGRKETLAKAVAFLITQYNEEPEKRKYLVIKDETSKNIELWIAAIECAFSPQIASVIPFATRMDKFTNTNRYTVKLGMYQMQMNLQDSNQKQRYRAMIVGVDERDKANINASRPIANSPFVLLDGGQKQADFNADISNCYFELITGFNEEHQKFCGEFLQTFFDLKPNSAIYDLYEIFTALNKPSLPDTRTLADVLDRLNKYKASDTGIYRETYKRVNTEVSRFMREDFSFALNIVNWLLTASVITGDTGAKQRLTEIVCNAFTGIIFGKIDNTAKRSYWTQIQRTGFKTDAALIVTNMETIRENSSRLNTFTPAEAALFIAIYLEAASLKGKIEQQDLKIMVKYGIKICYHNNDTNTMDGIVSSVSRDKSVDIQDFLFSLAKFGDDNVNEFIIKYIINRDAAIIASDNSMRSFFKKLKEEDLEHLAGSALIKRAGILNKPSEIERFIDAIKDFDFTGKEGLAKVFELLDAKIDTSNDALVELLQTQKPNGAKCKNSAHYSALNILSNNRRKKSLIESFKDLKNQDFPSITDQKYTEKLGECLLKATLTPEEQVFILDILISAPKGYFSSYINKLTGAAAKYQDKWNVLFKFVSDNKNKQIFDDIVQVLVDSKQNEKSLAALCNLLKDENSRKYYNFAFDKAREIVSPQKK
jgi:hypothetical protein